MLVALLAAAPASARVALLATGTNDVALLDVTTDMVVARPALPGPSRAVAIARDGRRAFVAAGNAVGAFDFGMVPAAPIPSPRTRPPRSRCSRATSARRRWGSPCSPGRRERVRGRRPAPLRARRPDAGHPPSRAPARHGERAGAVRPGDAGGRRAGQGPRGDGGDGCAQAAAAGEGQGRDGRRLRRRGARLGQRTAAPVRRAPGRAQAREAPAAPGQGRGRRGGRVARRAHAGRRRRARRRRPPRSSTSPAITCAASARAAARERPAGRPTACASTTPTAAAPRSRW